MILCDELIFKRLNAWNGVCLVKRKKKEEVGILNFDHPNAGQKQLNREGRQSTQDS